MVTQLRPISALPGYNPDATYLSGPSGIPMDYPARPALPASPMPQLPPINALTNQQIGGGGAGGAASSITENGNSYNGLVAGVASGFPGDRWGEANPLDMLSLGYGTGFDGRSTAPYQTYGNGDFGSFGNIFGKSNLPDNPALGLPPLPTETNDHGIDTPLGRITRADLVSGAAQAAMNFIPYANFLNTGINLYNGFETGMDKARYGDTQTQFDIGDGLTSINDPQQSQGILSKLLHPSTTLGDLAGQAYGALAGLGQEPIQANPNVGGFATYQDINNSYSPAAAAANWQTMLNNIGANNYGLSDADLQSLSQTPDLGAPMPAALAPLASVSYDLAASWQPHTFGGGGYGQDPFQPWGMVGGPPKGNQTT